MFTCIDCEHVNMLVLNTEQLTLFPVFVLLVPDVQM